MKQSCRLAVLSLAILVTALPATGTTVQQMDLGELCDRADRIFRGTVIEVVPGSLVAGGGELPTVTYRVLVEETFKGSYPADDKGVAEVTMLGSAKRGDQNNGSLHRFPLIAGMPALEPGDDYVLFVTQPSAVGLSTFVGLGQGCFTLLGSKDEMAVNETGNSGLIDGFAGGPMLYSELAAQINAEVGN